MKRQDIGLLLKLISLQKQEDASEQCGSKKVSWPTNWIDWDDAEKQLTHSETVVWKPMTAAYTARALEQATGISKSQINLSINRCYDIGLARRDRHLSIPRVNTRALFDFIVHGLKYIFPAKPMEITRGIATAFSAPVLRDKLMSAGEFAQVWPDARGKTKGQAIEPLFSSATFAVRQDPEMYALLALVDAIRVGQPREANLAIDMLAERIGLSPR